MHPRRTARESILGALYAYELTGEEKAKVLVDIFERNSFDEETKSYISDLYNNIVDNKTDNNLNQKVENKSNDTNNNY
jgi:transcription termination factor NusB